jgi:NAD-dependent dihydropyrimidine dehydrogenase PreA subunit
VAYVIAQPCIGTKDTARVDACPVDCIHPKKNATYDDGRPTFDEVPQRYIDPVECIDCGTCVPVCPVSAIFYGDWGGKGTDRGEHRSITHAPDTERETYVPGIGRCAASSKSKEAGTVHRFANITSASHFFATASTH